MQWNGIITKKIPEETGSMTKCGKHSQI